MLWDVFCRVIDNFGDIGVCWRLCRDLAGRRHAVRLWVDDACALSWMAPADSRPANMTVLDWRDAEHMSYTDARGQVVEVIPGDVVIEAFGCNPPDPFVTAMLLPEQPPRWINLEYLSAEDWVERCHALPSPVFSGPGVGLTKWFYYPGFTKATGGLLREPGLLVERDRFQASGTERTRWLAEQGVTDLLPDERLISVFCYDHAPVAKLLDLLAEARTPSRVLLTPGPASRLGQAWHDDHPDTGAVRLHFLPHLPQPEFDRLLWTCDINFVRGEDSAVRALWANRPHIWNIYPQDDGVHAYKLDAFMDRWMDQWPADVRDAVTSMWRAWNALGPIDDLHRLISWLDAPQWLDFTQQSVKTQAEMPDLVSQLGDFVTQTS